MKQVNKWSFVSTKTKRNMEKPFFYTAIFCMLIIASICTTSSGDVSCEFTNTDVMCEGARGKFLKHEESRDVNAIYIIKSDISELRTEDFLAFPSLTLVSILESNIQFPIHEYLFFEGLRFLKDIRIDYCNTTEDVKLLFAKNNDIISLSLRGNMISVITNDFFGHLHQINNIDLSENEIEYIEIGVFERLNTLATLNLASNRLGTSFDPLYLTLTTLTCIVCRANNIEECTEDDITRCKINSQIDQLWWKTHSVDIHLTNNPVCASILVDSSKPNPKTIVNAKINYITLNNCKTGSCFKHESRKHFLLEACNEQNSEIQFVGRDTAMSSTVDSSNFIVEQKEEKTEEDDEQIKLTVASYSSLLGFVAVFGILIGFLLSLAYKNKDKIASKIWRKKYTSVQEDIMQLHEAAQRGGLNEVHRLIKEGKNHKERDENGNTPLHLAAQENHTDVVEHLLLYNIDVNDRNSNGETPLIKAVIKDNREIIKILLKNGANKDARDWSGNTALHVAAYNGNRETLNILLEEKANIEIENNEGKTPLFQASFAGHHDIVKLLLENNAVVNKTALDGKTPLHIASWNGHHKVIDLLLQYGAEVNIMDRKGYTPLHNCSRKGHIEVLRSLIKTNKLDINVIDGESNMPLHHAASGGSIEVFNILLEEGADPNKRNKDNKTPLAVAEEAKNQLFADNLKQHLRTNSESVPAN